MKYMLLAVSLIFSFTMFPLHASDKHIRLRAREHLEVMSVRYGNLNDEENYSGFTNTLNLWLEKPFHYAYGFAFSPILGSAKTTSTAFPAGTSNKIRLWQLGLEAKVFLFPERNNLFGRFGIGGYILDTRGSMGKLGGYGNYLGLGWEKKIGKFGLAPEIGVRYVRFERNTSLVAFSPSIGIHFYMLPGDSDE